MESSGYEPIKNSCFNLERLKRSSRLTWRGIWALGRHSIWKRFDSDADLFCADRFQYLIFSQLCLKALTIWSGLDGTLLQRPIRFDVIRNNRCSFVNFDSSKFELSTDDVRFNVRTGPMTEVRKRWVLSRNFLSCIDFQAIVASNSDCPTDRCMNCNPPYYTCWRNYEFK